MKHSNKPLILPPFRELAMVCTSIGLLFITVIAVCDMLLHSFQTGLYVLAAALWLLPAIIFLLLAKYSRNRVIITTEGVSLCRRWNEPSHSLPWMNYSHLYVLQGYRRSLYLFTPEPMDKTAQLATVNACLKNRSQRFTHDGCLTINASGSQKEIDARLPAHIQRMPWIQCARL